jgi:hypothetical protein
VTPDLTQFTNGKSVRFRKRQVRLWVECLRDEFDILQGKRPMPNGVTRQDVEGTMRSHLELVDKYRMFIGREESDCDD